MTDNSDLPDTPASPARRALLGRAAWMAGGLALAKHTAMVQAAEKTGIAHAFRKDFRIGVAVSNQALDGRADAELDLIAREFNSVTAENAMKWGEIQPDGVNWRWERADRLVEFARKNKMDVLGHTLVWHSQVPASLFTDAERKPVSREVLLGKMHEHIDTLVGRYKGRVWAWDVVNEAVDEGNGWRRSQWLNILGEDFMEQAFRFAHAADKKAQLLYNDYNMENPKKVDFLVKVLKGYLDRGVPINGIGSQSHVGLDYPDLANWEYGITEFIKLGLKVHITELDVDVLPRAGSTSADIGTRGGQMSGDNNPWPQGLPDEMQQKLADRYEQLFRILLKHKKHIERVTLWGLHDGMSWKNNFPVRGRTNYPLLFDRQMRPKPAYDRLIKLANSKT